MSIVHDGRYAALNVDWGQFFRRIENGNGIWRKLYDNLGALDDSKGGEGRGFWAVDQDNGRLGWVSDYEEVVLLKAIVTVQAVDVRG